MGRLKVLWRDEETENIRVLSQGGFLHILTSLDCFASFHISISALLTFQYSSSTLLLYVEFSLLHAVFHMPPSSSPFHLIFCHFSNLSFHSISLFSPLIYLFNFPLLYHEAT